MRVFDASSMIYAWDNYPANQFPGLWEWLADQIADNTLVMPRVAFDEVEHKTPECAEWLRENGLRLLETGNSVMREAMRIKGLVGISGDNYHDGVGENDLFIIATAKLHGGELVSDERRQPNLPKDSRRFKIPAVCAMAEVAVPCMNFIEFLKESNAVFR